jgi:hypothetical protein
MKVRNMVMPLLHTAAVKGKLFSPKPRVEHLPRLLASSFVSR